MSTCSVEGCEGSVKAKKLCDMHLQRFYRSGSVGLATPRKYSLSIKGQPRVTEFVITKCRAAGCEVNSIGMGFCEFHYREFGLDKRRKNNQSN
jgi:hypothetical protein